MRQHRFLDPGGPDVPISPSQLLGRSSYEVAAEAASLAAAAVSAAASTEHTLAADVAREHAEQISRETHFPCRSQAQVVSTSNGNFDQVDSFQTLRGQINFKDGDRRVQASLTAGCLAYADLDRSTRSVGDALGGGHQIEKARLSRFFPQQKIEVEKSSDARDISLSLAPPVTPIGTPTPTPKVRRRKARQTSLEIDKMLRAATRQRAGVAKPGNDGLYMVSDDEETENEDGESSQRGRNQRGSEEVLSSHVQKQKPRTSSLTSTPAMQKKLRLQISHSREEIRSQQIRDRSTDSLSMASTSDGCDEKDQSTNHVSRGSEESPAIPANYVCSFYPSRFPATKRVRNSRGRTPRRSKKGKRPPIELILSVPNESWNVKATAGNVGRVGEILSTERSKRRGFWRRNSKTLRPKEDSVAARESGSHHRTILFYTKLHSRKRSVGKCP